jgi:hypothetical protein
MDGRALRSEVRGESAGHPIPTPGSPLGTTKLRGKGARLDCSDLFRYTALHAPTPSHSPRGNPSRLKLFCMP